MSQVEQRRDRLVQVCTALPEVVAEGDEHVVFRVGKKNFAYYLHNHHGDGKFALCCKAYPGDSEALMSMHPDRYYSPAYLGPKGWIGLRLDGETVDWDEVAARVAIAYRLIAPKRLAVQVP